MLKITYWADLECPFCYIGVNRMERVIREMGLEDQIIMQHRSFEVMPENGPEPVETFAEHVMKWGHHKNPKIADRWIDRVIEDAEKEGLVCKLHTVKLTNTAEAQRMIKYAQAEYNNDTAVKLMHAIWDEYFINNTTFTDKDMLLRACQKAGMDIAAAWDVINSTAYADQVKKEEEAAETLHVAQVPVFFFGTDFVLVGAQSEGVMKKCIEEALRNQALQNQ